MKREIAQDLQAAAERLSSNPAGTIAICRAILSQQPESSQAWHLLSEAALRLGNHVTALDAAQAAHDREPRNTEYAIQEAKCWALAGHRREALTLARIHIEEALPAALHGALGTIFSLAGDQQAARLQFLKALFQSPHNAALLYNLAAAERMTGHLADAEAHCDAALTLSPHDYRTCFLRADLRRWTEDRNHIAVMAPLFDPRASDWRGMVLLGFALFKECDDLGRHDDAFAYLKAASELQRTHMRYTIDADIAAIDAVMKAHTKEAIAAAARASGGEDAIFVIGLPRSGTTLVERMLASHSAVVSAGEPSDFVAALTEAAARTALPAGRDALIGGSLSLDLNFVASRYLERVRPEGSFERFIDKFPQNYLYAGLIHAALPRAKIVLLRRDPMDSCFAMYRAFFSGAYPFSYDLAELARYYAAFDRLCAQWRSVLPESAFMELRYEELVRDPEAAAGRLLSFTGLPWEEAVARPHENPEVAMTASAVQVRAPIHANSVAKWRRYAHHLAPLRAALAAAGY